jgi:uncharacterized membrane protein (DUF485 family)
MPASFGAGWMAQWSVTARLTVQELVTLSAVILIGLLWARERLALQLTSNFIARAVWIAVGLILTVIVLGVVAVVRGNVRCFG